MAIRVVLWHIRFAVTPENAGSITGLRNPIQTGYRHLQFFIKKDLSRYLFVVMKYHSLRQAPEPLVDFCKGEFGCADTRAQQESDYR
jgi:hypothetical protein